MNAHALQTQQFRDIGHVFEGVEEIGFTSVEYPLTMEFLRAIRAWKGDLGNRRSTSTVVDYSRAALRFFADTTYEPLTVTTRQIRAFTKPLRSQHAALYCAALNDLFGFMVRRGWRADNPLDDVPRPAQRMALLKRSLNEDELPRLLAAAVYYGRARELWTGQRIAMMMLAHYYTGPRPGELTKMLVSDVRFNDSEPHVYIFSPKTNTERYVPLNARAIDVFGELCHRRVGRIFDVDVAQYWAWMKRASVLAQIPKDKARPYALRHTFARTMLDRGVQMRDVQHLLGHRSIRTTEVYTVPGLDKLQLAVSVL